MPEGSKKNIFIPHKTSNMSPKHSIAIIGGGIGGLTTALCLEQVGLTNYRVYERAPEFREVGAAISVWPNALRVYQALGLLDALRPHWGVIHRGYIKSASGNVLSQARPDYELPTVCMHRAHLHGMLVEQLPAEKLITDHELTDIEIGDEEATLHFRDREPIESDLVIGADGINSVVRQAIIGDGAPIYRGYNCWRGIATLPAAPTGYSSETWGQGARVGIVPIKDGQFGWWATCNEPANTNDEPEGALAKLKRIFGTWHDPIPDLFDNSGDILKNPLGDRVPTRGWSQGPVVLMGDAAHPTTPNLGQGACMAIEGAYVLAQCLRKYDHLPDAFARYEDLHYPRSAQVTKQSLRMGKMGQIENPVGIAMRNTFIGLTPDKVSMRMLDRYFGYDVTEQV